MLLLPIQELKIQGVEVLRMMQMIMSAVRIL